MTNRAKTFFAGAAGTGGVWDDDASPLDRDVRGIIGRLDQRDLLDSILYTDDTSGTQVTASPAELNILDGVTATTAELNTLDESAKFVAAGATLTVTSALHNGRTIQLDTAAGSIVTLPEATGTGNVYTFLVTLIATSNSHIIQMPSATGAMQGFIFTMDDTSDNAQAFFAVSGTSDTITLNRSTTGSVTIGEYITITDAATNLFHVNGFTSSTGTALTPFSAAV